MAYKTTDFDSVLNATNYLEAAAFALGTASLYSLHEHPKVEKLATMARRADRLRKDVVNLLEEMKKNNDT